MECKRLHISGLTPQISAEDLTRRFSSFGTVKTLDGLGKKNALGDPRPYAYLTLEATKPQISKCFNLLSGTTWKGARLRIGEAKSDFQERIAKENEAAASAPPKKKRRLARGVRGTHSDDMSLVTTTNLRPGWHMTPLGRLIRPLRMRPVRPLTSALDSAKSRSRKRVKKPLVRARRKRIDPEEWGSSYLTGMMLESRSKVVLPERRPTTSEDRDRSTSPEADTAPEEASLSSSPKPPHQPVDGTKTLDGDGLEAEASRSLAMLNSLFGNDDADDDWGGQESLSDIELETGRAGGTVRPEDESDDIQFVPREHSVVQVHSESDAEVEDETQVEVQEDEGSSKPHDPSQPARLKDMFAARAEDAPFSLLGGLDLDLDLEDDPLGIAQAPILHPQIERPPMTNAYSTPSSKPAHAVLATLDTSLPLFFSPFASSAQFHQRSFNFCRTETSEHIRARWLERRGELTGEWKRRHREAVKSMRRRGGGVAD